MARSVTLGRRRFVTVDEARAAGRAAILPELERIAAEHAPDGGYGDTYWHGADGKVFWVAADWSTNEEVAAAEEAFLAVEGILSFESEAEGGAPVDGGYEPLPGWELAWPSADAKRAAALDAVEAAIEEIQAELALADDPPTRDLAASTSKPLEEVAPAASLEGLDRASLAAALEALERSHKVTAEGVVALVASAAADRGATNGDQLALETLAVLRAFAERPEAAPAPVTVNVPKQDVRVEVPAPVVTVNMPDQAAPIVNVSAPAAAPVQVDVHVPQAAPAAPAEVHVHVPEQTAAPAPELHVDVHVPEQRPRRVRVEFDAAGNKSYVAEEA